MTKFQIDSLSFGDEDQFMLIAGPCLIEGEEMAFDIAEKIYTLTQKYRIPLVFKGSYRKANRSRIDSYSGIGDEIALDILKRVGEHFSIPTTTDIHSDEEAAMAAKYVDVLQIPAFLCRQTSLLVAAGMTGKTVSVKKGQFMSPESMAFALDKVSQTGNHRSFIIERGTTFGYQDLVVDFRGIPVMQEAGNPVVLDCTHSLQQPNQSTGVTGGRPALIEHMAITGIAAGVDGLFIETHPNPSTAKSDGANMLPLDRLEALLEKASRVRQAILGK
ncbi:MAG: 3-deoxy-8-phosphooctulonate synthase [Saprospiraceae bacterium]